MSADKFLGVGSRFGGDQNVEDGSLQIYGRTLGAVNLQPSMPVRTDPSKRLISTKLLQSDIIGLPDKLNTLVDKDYVDTEIGKVDDRVDGLHNRVSDMEGDVGNLKTKTSKLVDGFDLQVTAGIAPLNAVNIRRPDPASGNFITWNAAQNPRWILGMFGAPDYGGNFLLRSIVDGGASQNVFSVVRSSGTKEVNYFAFDVPARTTQTVFTTNQELITKKYVDDKIIDVDLDLAELLTKTQKISYDAGTTKLNDKEIITTAGGLILDSNLQCSNAPVSNNQYTNKQYIDDEVKAVSDDLDIVEAKLVNLSVDESNRNVFNTSVRMFGGPHFMSGGGQFTGNYQFNNNLVVTNAFTQDSTGQPFEINSNNSNFVNNLKYKGKEVLTTEGGNDLENTFTTLQDTFTQDQELITKKYCDDEIKVVSDDVVDLDTRTGDLETSVGTLQTKTANIVADAGSYKTHITGGMRVYGDTLFSNQLSVVKNSFVEHVISTYGGALVANNIGCNTAPSADNQYTNKQYVDDSIGAIDTSQFVRMDEIKEQEMVGALKVPGVTISSWDGSLNFYHNNYDVEMKLNAQAQVVGEMSSNNGWYSWYNAPLFGRDVSFGISKTLKHANARTTIWEDDLVKIEYISLYKQPVFSLKINGTTGDGPHELGWLSAIEQMRGGDLAIHQRVTPVTWDSTIKTDLWFACGSGAEATNGRHSGYDGRNTYRYNYWLNLEGNVNYAARTYTMTMIQRSVSSYCQMTISTHSVTE